MRVWAKLILNEKIIKSIIFENDLSTDVEDFDRTIMDLCYTMDIPTPLILKTNISNFTNFKICKFNRDDFVDAVNFDTLVLEDATIE